MGRRTPSARLAMGTANGALLNPRQAPGVREMRAGGTGWAAPATRCGRTTAGHETSDTGPAGTCGGRGDRLSSGGRSQRAEPVTIMVQVLYCPAHVFDRGGALGADRQGHIWAMLAELDPALAARLRGYNDDRE